MVPAGTRNRHSKPYTLSSSPSAPLGNDIDKCGLALAHHCKRTLQRIPELFWIGNRPLTPNTHAICYFSEIDVRLGQGCTNPGAGDAARMHVRHNLNEHLFLM